MSERAERLVEHMLRVARPGEQLYSVVTRGPETEDTRTWVLTERGDVRVADDSVYPGMARVAGHERIIAVDEAKREIVAALLGEDTDGTLLPYMERKWRMVVDG